MANAFTLFGEIRVDSSGAVRSLRIVDQQLTNTTRKMNEAEKAAKRNAQGFKRYEEALRKMSQEANRSSGFMADLKNSMFGQVTAGFLAAEAILKVASVMKSGVDTAARFTAQMQQTKISLTSIMGSADGATEHLAELAKLARSNPLELPSLAKMSQRLQSAGVEAKRIVPLLKDIGNVAAATGDLGAERMEGLGVALSQIASKSIVSAEEMEQLAERGVPAWRMLSQQMGLTIGQTRKMAEEGKISADTLFDAFQKFSRSNFGDAMEKQSRTFSGAMQIIENVALQTANRFMQPLYDEVSKFASKIATSLKNQEAEVKASGVSLGFALGEAIGDGIARSNGGRGVLGAVSDFGKEIGRFSREVNQGVFKGMADAKDPFVHYQQNLDRYNQELQRYMMNRDKLLQIQRQQRSQTVAPGAIMPGDNGNAAAEAARSAADFARKEADANMSAATSIFGRAQNAIADFARSAVESLNTAWGSMSSQSDAVVYDWEQLVLAVDGAIQTIEQFEDATRDSLTPAQQHLLDLAQAWRREDNVAAIMKIRTELGKALSAAREFSQEIESFSSDRFNGGITSLADTVEANIDAINAEWDALKDSIGEPPPIDKWEMFWATMREQLGIFKDSLPSIKQSIGENLLAGISQIGDVFANAVMQWDGTAKGFFKSLAQGFRQLVSQLLAELVRLMVMKALFSLFGGLLGNLGNLGSTAASSASSTLGGGGFNIGGAISNGVRNSGGWGGGGSTLGSFGTIAPSTAIGSSMGGSTMNNSVTINLTGGSSSSQTAEQIKRAVLAALNKTQHRNK